jgi:photosystem II stability/assembly factor-like uncharacterized protein
MRYFAAAIACCLLSASGVLWYQGQDLPQRGRLDAIFFESENHGFVRLCCPARNTVYETQDGGRNWHRSNDTHPRLRRGRVFVNSHKGFSVVEDEWPHSSIQVTEDGGNTWKVVFRATGKSAFYFDEIQAVSETEVWAGPYRTRDGGLTWEQAQVPGGFPYFVNHERGWSLSHSLVWRTKDGGKTWEKIGVLPNCAPFDLGDFYFLDSQRGWMIGGSQKDNVEGGDLTGIVLHTEDGGITWQKQAIILNHYLWSVFFLNENTGWVAGTDGSFLKTSDGGKTWFSPKTGEYAKIQIPLP